MSFLSRLADASVEVTYDLDSAMASQMGRRDRRRAGEERERKDKEEAEGAALAQKIEVEEKDEVLAHNLREAEAKEEESRQFAEQKLADGDVALARKLSAKWEKADLRAANKQEKAKQRTADRDGRVARKMQLKAISALEKDKSIQDMQACWTAPRLMVSDHDEGICIQARLPNLKAAEVTLEPDTMVIVVRAQPEKVVFFENARQLGLKVNIPEAIRFSVDLNVVGGEPCVAEQEITHTYNEKDGVLSILVGNVELSGAGEKEPAPGQKKSRFKFWSSRR